MPKSEYDKLKTLLSQKETQSLTLSVESQSLKKKLEQQEQSLVKEVEKLRKDLEKTKGYLQLKEEEVVMMRREKQLAQVQNDSENADKLRKANQELNSRIDQLESELQQAVEGQKTLLLQRKTLI